MPPFFLLMMTTTTDLNKLSLSDISSHAVLLWEDIENANSPEEIEELVSALVLTQEAQEKKVDSICWVVDQLQVDLESLEARKAKAVKLLDSAITKRKAAIERINATLLHLHLTGTLSDKVVGKQRSIGFAKNPPSVQALLVSPEELPQQFVKVETTHTPLKKEILKAHKAGENISDIAIVHTGKHVVYKQVK